MVPPTMKMTNIEKNPPRFSDGRGNPDFLDDTTCNLDTNGHAITCNLETNKNTMITPQPSTSWALAEECFTPQGVYCSPSRGTHLAPTGNVVREELQRTKESGQWSPARDHGRSNKSRKRSYKPLEVPRDEIQTHNRFYILESIETDKTIENLGVFEIEKGLLQNCSGPLARDPKILRNGNLLIRTRNAEQSKRIERMKNLAGLKVKATPHAKLNTSQGTVLARRWEKYSTDELREHLTSEGVTEVVKLPSRPDKRYTGDRYLLTFNRMQPPEKIRGGLQVLDVRLYIPRPRRCYNCQGYGHVGRYCKRNQAICVQCGDTAHMEGKEACQRPAKCRNCGQSHPASDIRCPIYRMEKEIMATITKEKISPYEAKKRIREQYPDRRKTYAETVKTQRPMPLRDDIRNEEPMERAVQMPTRLQTTSETQEMIKDSAEASPQSERVQSPKPIQHTRSNEEHKTTEKRKASSMDKVSTADSEEISPRKDKVPKAMEAKKSKLEKNTIREGTPNPLRDSERGNKVSIDLNKVKEDKVNTGQHRKSLINDYHMPPNMAEHNTRVNVENKNKGGAQSIKVKVSQRSENKDGTSRDPRLNRKKF